MRNSKMFSSNRDFILWFSPHDYLKEHFVNLLYRRQLFQYQCCSQTKFHHLQECLKITIKDRIKKQQQIYLHGRLENIRLDYIA